MIVTERWTKHKGSRSADDIMASMDHVPCALLHGDGRWVVYGKDPVLLLDNFGCRLNMERLGTRPPFFPDLIGWTSYEFGLGMDTAFPEPRDGGPPGCRMVMFRTMELVDRRERITYRGERDLPSLGLHCPVQDSPFAASRQDDSDTRTFRP